MDLLAGLYDPIFSAPTRPQDPKIVLRVLCYIPHIDISNRVKAKVLVRDKPYGRPPMK
ncbi:uncharacterized protein PHALS_06397 [Plasmopara halstedii]|uniref:Uncharacterized protein n=1 Tax=Plasmopara halstedii TaxID=4781 RepID=A0A0P1B2V3_PLAHL|nr:uncharacterized protein PHALS_06397 [Plasmopara halstedii]CEG48581.1 hypothetical protein PHALS_06397 [Plasmopara halstedii]|eukprot:XP_024584950.1 hypothetical protein PHALS_06397 [Plasmopara halstedii]